MFCQWKHWIQPSYLAPKRFSKMAEGSDEFARTCVCTEFRFHFGHPYCLVLSLCYFLRRVVKLSLNGWNTNSGAPRLITSAPSSVPVCQCRWIFAWSKHWKSHTTTTKLYNLNRVLPHERDGEAFRKFWFKLPWKEWYLSGLEWLKLHLTPVTYKSLSNFSCKGHKLLVST